MNEYRRYHVYGRDVTRIDPPLRYLRTQEARSEEEACRFAAFSFDGNLRLSAELAKD